MKKQVDALILTLEQIEEYQKEELFGDHFKEKQITNALLTHIAMSLAVIADKMTEENENAKDE